MTHYHPSRFLTVLLTLVVALSVLPTSRTEAASASLYLSPSAKSVTEGGTFSVALYVSTDFAINAGQAKVNFPTNLLQVTSLSKSGIFTLWAEEPSFSNASGTVSFAGGLPTPGYKGKAGKILTITFKAKDSGTAKVTISGGSVLANDGQGTNILKSQGSGTYTVKKAEAPPPPGPTFASPVLGSSSHPDQAKWYNVADIAASWRGGEGVKGYSVVFDQTPSTVPAQNISTIATTFARSGVADGVWYLHVRAQYDAGWSSATHMRFNVDTTPPETFAISLTPNPTANFSTNDATSGVDHYELAIDDASFATVTSPYKLPSQSVGKHTVKVRAYDQAGNFREASAEFEIFAAEEPIIIDLTPVLVGEEPLVIRGFSLAQDSIRLTIDGTDYGPYPVSQHLDGEPPRPAPEGKVAWKIELKANVGRGVHEITFTAVNPAGEASKEIPPLKFRVVTNAVRIGPWIIPTIVIVNLLVLLVLLAITLAVYYGIRYHRLRRRLAHRKRSQASKE